MNKIFSSKINLFKPRKEKNKSSEPSAPPEKFFQLLNTKTWCVGGKHFCNTNNISEHEKRNPKTKKLVKIMKGKCSICGRNESPILTK